jgi:hypothetical protein
MVMDDELPTPRLKIRSIALAVIAAGGLAYASVAHGWAIDPIADRMGGAVEYGLRARQDCAGAGCQVRAFTELTPPPSSTLRAFGWVTSIACWSAAVTLLLSALLVAVNRLVVRPMAPTTIALLSLLVGMISGCVFVAQARAIGTVGWTFWVFGVATVLGIVAAQGLARFKPGDPFWDNPPPVTDDPDKW